MLIDRASDIGDDAFADPAHEEKPRGAGSAENERNENESDEILVDKDRVLAAEAVVDQAPARHRYGERCKRRKDERDEGERDHAPVLREERHEPQNGPHRLGGLAPLRFFLDGLDDRIGYVAHALSPVRASGGHPNPFEGARGYFWRAAGIATPALPEQRREATKTAASPRKSAGSSNGQDRRDWPCNTHPASL